jgi:putative lipoprotein (rSAM/lipoprotein system)
MRNKLLSLANRCIVAMVSFLGFQSCEHSLPLYGTPYRQLTVQGKVTNTKQEPLDNMQVVVKYFRYNGGNDTTYTNGKGEYSSYGEYVGQDSMTIVVNDTAGAYASDSARVPVEYVEERLSYTATADIELKENK